MSQEELIPCRSNSVYEGLIYRGRKGLEKGVKSLIMTFVYCSTTFLFTVPEILLVEGGVAG
jgi:hypothetical protein